MLQIIGYIGLTLCAIGGVLVIVAMITSNHDTRTDWEKDMNRDQERNPDNWKKDDSDNYFEYD